ncbi:hypothetical protein EJ04DRAFT_448899 [Polyplosphaeria fusca]|uniref:Uncharacterized protein n=1 Tax=Polyplosphaeria fusca TaxID=682080 RepID=A0A9P4UVW9_9PLEO|nr:hypothetical protein EJ04DRAFT_448899 [Polyplosphaeria fusca]
MLSTQISQVTSIFKPKPVFNRPFLERQHRVSRILYVVNLSLLFVLSGAVIATKAMTIAFIEDNNDTGFMFETGDPEPTVLAALPKMLFVAPAKIAMCAAAIGVFVSIGHLIFIVKDWSDGTKTQAYSFRRNSMFIHLTNSILILFSLVSTFVTHKSTSHFLEGYINRKADRPGEGIRYNIGTFDLETWSCELKDVPGARMVADDYARQCSVEIAGRLILIPFLIITFVVTGISIAVMLGGKRNADGERLKTEEVGLEMGKFNAI